MAEQEKEIAGCGMKILSIVWYKVLPAEYGGQKGIATFNKYLSRHYPIVCACSANNEPSPELPYKVLPLLPVGKLQFINPFCIAKIKSIARHVKPTHIIVEHPYHGFAGVRACGSTGAKLVVHSHNIESQRFREMGKWWWWLLHAYEKWVHRKATLNLFKTEDDLRYALRHFGLDTGKCIIVPYGIEKPALADKSKAGRLIRKRHEIAPSAKILLFAGTLDYIPNAKAAEAIYNEIAPRLADRKPDIKIIICGRNRESSFDYLKKLSHPCVIYAGEVNNIADYFAAADAFIDPVQQSSGIQTKIIDALSHHCNVVAFKNIINRIPYAEEQPKVFAAKDGDWDQFAGQVVTACAFTGNTGKSFLDYYNEERIVELVKSKIEIDLS